MSNWAQIFSDSYLEFGSMCQPYHHAVMDNQIPEKPKAMRDLKELGDNVCGPGCRGAAGANTFKMLLLQGRPIYR